MVFFTCNACGESLKKNQVEKHYRHKCRSCEVLTCVDCHKDFPGDTYQDHTKCISEDEKYSAKGWQPKASANKGEKKQQNWIENLHQLMAEESVTSSLDSDVSEILDFITKHENIPRKKKKFANFVRNIRRGVRPATIDKTWEFFEQALKKPGKQQQQQQQDERRGDPSGQENGQSKEEEQKDGAAGAVGEEAEQPEGADKVEERLGVKMFPGIPALLDQERKKSNKKRKKAGSEGDPETSAESEKVPKKKKKTILEGTPSSGAAKPGSSKFVWEDVIENLLKKEGGDMKVKRLKKKVVAEYMSLHADPRRSKEELSLKVEKKLARSGKFKVVKEMVTLKCQ